MSKNNYKPGELLLFDYGYFRYIKRLYPPVAQCDAACDAHYVTDPDTKFYYLLQKMQEVPGLLLQSKKVKLKDFSTSNEDPANIITEDFALFSFLLDGEIQHHVWDLDNFSSSQFLPYLFLGKT